MVSLMQAMSAGRDPVTRRDAYNFIEKSQQDGAIVFKSDSTYFSTTQSKKKNSSYLYLGNDTLHLINAAKVIRTRNSKVKKKPYYYEAYQLMRGYVCIAAIDYSGFNPLIYLDKTLSREERLIIGAFFMARSFRLVF